MMKIVLVEDEPAAMRLLKSIIERRCRGYEIADMAENGAEGFEKICLIKPDVVITDVKMPIMDGISLVSRVKEEFPFISSIIVSGYQDFEYARSAIKSGVVDYLSKPVNAEQMKTLLESIRKKLENDYYAKRVGLLEHILSGAATEAWQVEKYLPFKRYSAAIIRKNGLPSRFHSKHTSAMQNPAADICDIPGNAGLDGLWVLPGRDEMEQIIFCTPEIIGMAAFKAFVEDLAQKPSGGFHTVVYVSDFCGLQDLPKKVRNMYRTLDCKIIIGLTQSLFELPEGLSVDEHLVILDETLGNRIDFFASNALENELKTEFTRLLASWQKDKRTQIWIESILRQILQHIAKHSAAARDEQNHDMEFLLDEALCYAASFDELLANIWDIVAKIMQFETKNAKVDTAAFFDSIRQYLEKNLSEPLTLQSVCARFSISQTYLSRLFRKYECMSFNEYLTNIRIDRVKRLISENPNIPLKDVAAFVGYNDQFYLSRVFKLLIGVPPSEYARDALKSGSI